MLCVDEKSQIQALDRTQPLLPLRPGQIERRTHDYERHGTTTLFAALDVKAGTIVGKCMPRHRAQEFRKFLDEIERSVATDLDMQCLIERSDFGVRRCQAAIIFSFAIGIASRNVCIGVLPKHQRP